MLYFPPPIVWVTLLPFNIKYFPLTIMFPAQWTMSTSQISFLSTLTCLKIHYSSITQSNGSWKHSASSISSVALPCILYKLFNYIEVWWPEFTNYRFKPYHCTRIEIDLYYVSNNISNDKYSYLLLSTYYVFSTWLNFSHAFFPLNSQKPLPVGYWKHSFTNKENRKMKVRTLPNMTQMNYISLNRNCEIFFFIPKPTLLCCTFSWHFQC